MLGARTPTGMAQPSKTQIDRLGDRLKKGSPNESDLISLDNYRRSFSPAYEAVVRAIRDQLDLEPTGRPGKSTRSIMEKLNRESIRLTQVQDIAGCRVVVSDMSAQELIVALIGAIFPGASVIDRRTKPSYGYRAVHLVPRISGKLVEIQVRTSLQHVWGELSEKSADVIDPDIKYGGGPDFVRDTLLSLSSALKGFEDLEYRIQRLLLQGVHHEIQDELQSFEEKLVKQKRSFAEQCHELMVTLDQIRS